MAIRLCSTSLYGYRLVSDTIRAAKKAKNGTTPRIAAAPHPEFFAAFQPSTWKKPTSPPCFVGSPCATRRSKQTMLAYSLPRGMGEMCNTLAVSLDARRKCSAVKRSALGFVEVLEPAPRGV